MKTLLSLLAVFCVSTAIFGQKTYTTLNSAQHVFFMGPGINLEPYETWTSNNDGFYDYDTVLVAYRIDTTRIVDGDSTFVFNPMRRNLFNRQRTEALYYCDSTHWLGKSVNVTTDGLEVYQNGANESIYYNTLARPGDRWLFCDNAEWGQFYATIDTMTEVRTVLGTTDTIYTIHLTLEDISGSRIPHALDDTEIKVSMNHGFIQTIDHFHFPHDTNSFSLCGTSYPRMGITDLSYCDVYDMSVGDEFHYIYTNTGSNIYNQPRIVRIDSFYIDGSEKVFVQSEQTCTGDSAKIQRTEIRVDTTREAQVLPFENMNRHYIHNGLQRIEFEFCAAFNLFDTIYSSDSCTYCSTDGNSYSDFSFGECMGKNYEYHFYGSTPHYDLYSVTRLVYFKKGDHAVGDSVTLPACESGVVDIRSVDHLLLYPNPALEEITFDFHSHQHTSLRLLNADGRLIREIPINPERTWLTEHIGDFASGIYFAVFSNEKGMTLSRKFIKL